MFFGHVLMSIPRTKLFQVCCCCDLRDAFFFANAEIIGQKIRLLVNEAPPKVVVLDLSAVFDLEYSALKALSEGEKRQRDLGVATWLVGLNPGVLQMVQRSPLGIVLGREKMHFSLELAVAKYAELSARAGASNDHPPSIL
jgi:sulfate permease, SulP family